MITRKAGGFQQVWYIPLPYSNNMTFVNGASCNLGGNPENFSIVGSTTIHQPLAENWNLERIYWNVFLNTRTENIIISLVRNGSTVLPMTILSGVASENTLTGNVVLSAGDDLNGFVDMTAGSGRIDARSGHVRLVKN